MRRWSFDWIRDASLFSLDVDLFRDGFVFGLVVWGRGFWVDTWLRK